ncbi:DUF4393 domain-containing protein [Polynucleobacter wuianus]|uniref:Abi-alpha family protein n=1 Tax=Polynucleobacter wuianus TaxID=1743168 RepID=UPI001C0D9FA2|nr:Abi-alpha family protein [Polynucleobacter wuianus]MBU3610994.1 DUF4393 domain-containing protein [Polynucleobacter wuianus]
MDHDSNKTIQELAKTTNNAIDASREAGKFIARFVAGSLEQGMGIFEDKLKYMRWERQIRMIKKSEEFLLRAGLSGPTRSVPLNIAIPILQAAGIEEDDDLQNRWAALLVNASNANFNLDMRRSYISILEQLNSFDVLVMEAIYSLPFGTTQHDGIAAADLPSSPRVPAKDEGDLPQPSEKLLLSLSNLARLGCLRPAGTWGGGENYARINPTVAGKVFIEACRLP